MLVRRLGAATVILLIFLSSAFAQSGAQIASGQFTNDDVIRMIDEGISAELVVDRIKAQGSENCFDTSPAALKELKESDVPESVISAMVEARVLARAAQQPSPTPAPVATAGGHTAGTNSPPRGKVDCKKFDDDDEKGGVVWCGTESTLDFKVLAERSAPILWFAPNEPLLKKHYKIPQPLPCDPRHKAVDASPGSACNPNDFCCGHRNDESAVVYYQIRRIVREWGSTGETFTGRVLNLERIEKLTLKYYFYYCVDCGFGSHQHDLENIELEIHIEKEEDGPRYRARVDEVVGAAHGVHWYDNRLKVREDTVFPITILVEEGKHASAPDSDGGGTFQAKTDINNRRNDAWGVRDKLGRSKLPTFSYYLRGHTDQTRPNKLEYRIGSKEQVKYHPDLFDGYEVETWDAVESKAVVLKQPEELYELRELGSDCTAERIRDNRNAGKFKLDDALARRMGDGEPDEVDTTSEFTDLLRSSFFMEEDDSLPENLWVKLLQFSYRWDGSHGFSTTLPLPVARFFGGYVIPRAHFTGFSSGNRRYGLDYLYTPSASRYADWYGAGGIEWYRESPGRPFKFGPAWEVGLRFRGPIKKKLFPGGRVGVRTSPTKKFSFVYEVGGGLF